MHSGEIAIIGTIAGARESEDEGRALQPRHQARQLWRRIFVLDNTYRGPQPTGSGLGMQRGIRVLEINHLGSHRLEPFLTTR
jgi:hypothetical protein